MSAVFLCSWIDGNLSRFHEVEGASQSLDNGFLDRPEQGCCFIQLSVRQTQGMIKLLWMEDPVKGVVALKLIAHCHIDADI